MHCVVCGAKVARAIVFLADKNTSKVLARVALCPTDCRPRERGSMATAALLVLAGLVLIGVTVAMWASDVVVP